MKKILVFLVFVSFWTACSKKSDDTQTIDPESAVCSWRKIDGFRFAFADPADEARAQAAAEASTQVQKDRCVKEKLWEKYDKKQARK